MRFDGRMSRDKKKELRAARLRQMTVEVERPDGTILEFDADEESQKRLDRFSRRARVNGRDSLPWIMANNTRMEVTPEEMEQALDLALEKQGEEWVAV
jgi:hypothetical protein